MQKRWGGISHNGGVQLGGGSGRAGSGFAYEPQLYTNPDLIGVETASAENIIALAQASATGWLRRQHHAALMTRGVYEIARLARPWAHLP